MKKEDTEDQRKIDDKDGNCKQCGHPLDSHIVIAYNTNDFSKGGEIRCPVPNCPCFSTISFNLEA